MKSMSSLCVAVTLVAAVSAATPATPAVAKVRQLRAKLSQALSHGGLPGQLAVEAKQVDADAERALGAAGAAPSSLAKVMDEYKQFVGHLLAREATLRQGVTSEAAAAAEGGVSAEALAHAAALVPALEARVQKVLTHIEADEKGLNPEENATRASLIHELQSALAKPLDSQANGVVEHAVQLHDALQSAHDFLAKRTQDLTQEQKQLSEDVEGQEEYLLYMMLKQRKALPMKSQVAILKRHQFKKCSAAQKLLKEHKSGLPLYKQLESLLPQKQAQALTEKVAPPKAAGHLEAAGSDGRVHIVSSRMKNEVQSMLRTLTAARDKLAQIASGSSQATPSEQDQAKHILVGLDEELGRARSTNDLKTQLEAMDEVQKRLAGWTQDAKSAHVA